MGIIFLLGHLARKKDGSRGLSVEELSHVDEVAAALKELVGFKTIIYLLRGICYYDVQHSATRAQGSYSPYSF